MFFVNRRLKLPKRPGFLASLCLSFSRNTGSSQGCVQIDRGGFARVSTFDNRSVSTFARNSEIPSYPKIMVCASKKPSVIRLSAICFTHTGSIFWTQPVGKGRSADIVDVSVLVKVRDRSQCSHSESYVGFMDELTD